MIETNYLNQYSGIAGCDEVGRGPLAGPVVGACAYIEINDSVAAAKYLNDLKELGVTDSKKLTQKKRIKFIESLGYKVRELQSSKKYTIVENEKFIVTLYIQELSHEVVDDINILNASLKAMRDSFVELQNNEALVLIDGNKYFKKEVAGAIQEPVVKGDSKSVLIGLASIFAKEYRDHLMELMGQKYPGYGLESHAGYPTPTHKEAIAKLGPSPIHRKTFKGVREFIQ